MDDHQRARPGTLEQPLADRTERQTGKPPLAATTDDQEVGTGARAENRLHRQTLRQHGVHDDIRVLSLPGGDDGAHDCLMPVLDPTTVGVVDARHGEVAPVVQPPCVNRGQRYAAKGGLLEGEIQCAFAVGGLIQPDDDTARRLMPEGSLEDDNRTPAVRDDLSRQGTDDRLAENTMRTAANDEQLGGRRPLDEDGRAAAEADIHQYRDVRGLGCGVPSRLRPQPVRQLGEGRLRSARARCRLRCEWNGHDAHDGDPAPPSLGQRPPEGR